MGFPCGSAVKNLPTMQETQIRSLGQEDPLEKEITAHSSILCLGNPMDRGAWRAIVHGIARVIHDLVTKQQQQHSRYLQCLLNEIFKIN